MDIKINLPFS